jgi:hypothetical protein
MRIVAIISLSILLFLCAGCLEQAKRSEPKPAEVVPLSSTLPTLEPVEGYPWEATKDAVTIKLAPSEFASQPIYERSLKEVWELLAPGDGTKLYKVTDRPHHLKVTPDDLSLQLHVTNNLSHVLRFQGAVVSMKLDGKSLPIDENTQDELLRAVLTPYANLDVTLKGPDAASLEKASTLDFAIYDVITEVDAANNPTKRTTFEWIFSVRPQNVQVNYQVVSGEKRFTEYQISQMPKYTETPGE